MTRAKDGKGFNVKLDYLPGEGQVLLELGQGDLPEPEGPTMPIVSPARMASEISFSVPPDAKELALGCPAPFG